MKFSYKFHNLLGTVYHKGNIIFTPDGNSVISPVGNRISIFDLKNNKAKTLSLESPYNYTSMDISPNGCLLVAGNENGLVQMISMVSCMVIGTYKCKEEPSYIKFSPNGKYFAVAWGQIVYIYYTPGDFTGQYNAFVLHKAFYCDHDITMVDWSFDSKLISVGKNNNTTLILPVDRVKYGRRFNLTGHMEPIVGAFFENNSLNLNTISRNGTLCLWECSIKSDEMIYENEIDKIEPDDKRKKPSTEIVEDDIDEAKEVEKSEKYQMRDDELNLDMEIENRDKQGKLIKINENEKNFSYKKISRHNLAEEAKKANSFASITSTAYHKKTKLLIIAFSTGDFYLYELPEVNMIHSLNISEYSITAASFNSIGDWIGLASSELGQILVWEWQSEQYVMKQQGHASEMTCITYSPDGQFIATGGNDSKVKIWNTSSGFCFVTFEEHTSAVTSIEFSNNKKFVVSASLDGTVRAYDIIRYRNFRTFTTPQPVQFGCVSIDVGSDLIAAGGIDTFEIYLWSIKLGLLLEVISGHESPISCLVFSPVLASTTLVSGSWDKTIKIWNALERSSEHETIEMITDVTALAFKPNGEEVAVATLNGNISIFNVKLSQQIASIEGRNDLGAGRSDTDIASVEKNLAGKCFTSLAYSSDGECLLAAGKSKNICIYHVKEQILLKKFEITQNQSFDAVNEFINRRNITDFGNLALIEERDQLEGGNVKIRLPGVLKGDMAARNYKPEINVFSIRFSPSGQTWAAATTEGLLIYSLDKGLVFDPFHLSMEITPKSIKKELEDKKYSSSLLMALKLNEPVLINQIIEQIPHIEINLVITSIPDVFLHRLLQFLIKIFNASPHIEFYLKWINSILTNLGQRDNVLSHQALVGIQECYNNKYERLSKICDFNKYTLQIMKSIATSAKEEEEEEENGEMNENDDVNDSDEELLINRVEEYISIN